MIVIDGSQGEGGGQILRSSLALSLVTGRPLRLERIRAGRRRPGLMRQHLTAVRAAAAVGAATVSGDAIGSTALQFEPSARRAGDYRFAVGSAGSAMLVLQTVLPALLTADGPSQITVEGGTHNPFAPPFDFVERAYLPLVRRLGPQVDVTLGRHGFYPAGGGRVSVTIEPAAALTPFDLCERGELRGRRVRAIVANLPLSIAETEVRRAARYLAWSEADTVAESVPAAGPGNVVFAELETEGVTEVFCSFGEKGRSARTVAADLVARVRRYLTADVPVGPYLADQLVLLLALAGGGRFRTLAPTRHLTTNVDVIQRFLDCNIDVKRLDSNRTEVAVRG